LPAAGDRGRPLLPPPIAAAAFVLLPPGDAGRLAGEDERLGSMLLSFGLKFHFMATLHGHSRSFWHISVFTALPAPVRFVVSLSGTK
jgi:hypothetical protein